MKRYIEGEDRSQTVLLPTCLDDYVAEANPVRAVDAFAEELDLKALGFAGVDPAVTGPAGVSPRCPSEGPHLRVSEPCSVQPPA
jgi:transposase